MLDQVDIDTSQPPFDLLDEEGKAQLRAAVDLIYFAQDSTILSADAQADAAFVIAKGMVQAYDTRASGGERAFADLGPGDLFGSHAVLSGRARHSYRAAEECLCYSIPASVFRQLTADHPRFGAWFLEGMAIKRRHRQSSRYPTSGRALLARISDTQPAPPVRVRPQTAIADATRKLKQQKVECLIVDDPQLGPGIVTRTDLLEALALDFQSPTAPVAPLASRPLLSVDRNAQLFEALVLMTEHQIERVAVTDAGQLLGTLGMAEVLAHYSSTSHLIALELDRAHNVLQVADAAKRLPELIGNLYSQGAKMRFLMDLVSALNGRILDRLYRLCVPTELQPRLCLLVLGSEGRSEQLLRTDQDNALVAEPDVDEAALTAAAEALSAAIGQCGWPPCPGNVMISNADWRGDAALWQSRIARWLDQPDAQAMLNLAILTDARAVAGNADLAEPVGAALRSALGQDLALRSMAKQAVEFHTPLSWFGRIKHSAEGTDLKKGAIFPIVHGLRTLALAEQITQRNSFARADALVERGALSKGFGRDLQQSLALCMRLRLDTQLHGENGDHPNHVQVDRLPRLDRELLRDALRVVGEFQDHLRQRFRLEH